jgi:hypothetical protein
MYNRLLTSRALYHTLRVTAIVSAPEQLPSTEF